MYVFSFFRSLFRPRNVLSALYFLANLAIVFFIFYLINIPVVADENMNKIYSGLIGLGLNLLFIFISLSPVGEYFWRVRNGIKKTPAGQFNVEWITATAAFKEVRARAMSASRMVSSKVTLYYSAEQGINAFALGHRTIIVTAGMLRLNNPNVFRGVFAHEFGHIAHGDSDLNLGINVCNGFIVVFMTIISLMVSVVVSMLHRDGTPLLIAMVIRVLFNVIIVGLFRLWTLIGVLCVNASSRRCEFAADGFAKKLGYGNELMTFLNALDGKKTRSSWYSLMFRTHPDTVDRVAALAA